MAIGTIQFELSKEDAMDFLVRDFGLGSTF